MAGMYGAPISLSLSLSLSFSLSLSLSLSLTAHADQELQSAGRIFVEASVPAQRPAPQHTAGANDFLAGNGEAVRREGARSEPPAIRRASEREEESSSAAVAGMCAGTQRASAQSRTCPRSIAWPARSCPWLAYDKPLKEHARVRGFSGASTLLYRD